MKRKLTATTLLCISAFILSLNTFGQAKLPDSVVKTVYITPTSHYDLGFVEAPDQVRDRAAHHIDEVIRVAESDPNFRWTIESVWQVEEWLKRQQKPTSVLPKDKEKIARLMDLIKSGRVALSTAWGSMHTDFMGDEELNRICYGYTRLKKNYGIDSELALMDDVPGHPTTIPSVLANSGTKYLVTGTNLFLQDATSVAPGHVPFYWLSPDGNRVLTWISKSKRGGYTEGMTDFFVDPYSFDPYTDRRPFDMFNPDLTGKKTDLEIMEIGIRELIDRYNSANYKYDSVLVMYAHDFVEPTNIANLEKAVKLWNSKHPEIELKIATPNDFFAHIESKYSGQLETYKGEWSGLWSEAKTRSPKISAMARFAHDQTPAAETLWSGLAMTRGVSAPIGNFSKLYALMFGYDEHSGAGNNGWPQLNSIRSLEDQNRQYVRDMKAARDEAELLSNKGVELIAQPDRYAQTAVSSGDSFNALVYNGTSWDRSDIAQIKPPNEHSSIVNIKDNSSGQNIVFDTDADGKAIFVTAIVPSFGYRSYTVTAKEGKPQADLIEVKGRSIQNDKWSVSVRNDGNVESIKDLAARKELVNAAGERPFNDLLRIEGSEASVVRYPASPKITVQKGKVLSRISVSRERSIYPVSVITIYNGIDRVDIHNELDPHYEGFVGGKDFWGDSYYFAFPFNLNKDTLKVLREGQKWFDTLPDDYLPGARKDSVTTQHSIAMTDGKASALILHRQAFHWSFSSFVSTKVRAKDAPAEFSKMYTGQFPLPEATLYSRALRNASVSDTSDEGIVYMDTVEPGLDGNYIYDYAVMSDGRFDPVRAKQAGAEFNLPLAVRYTQTTAAAPSASFFSVAPTNVQIVDVKPITESVTRGEVSAAPLNPPVNKVFIVRLQEFAGRDSSVTLKLPAKIRSAEVVTLNELATGQKINVTSPLSVSIKKFQTLTLKVEVE